ncbi:bacterioferritin [Alkalimarinus alittae]|uniref:Bacterioferritin n=1 Tax=Alkalimarinus alittae TaxID=2961619 RepID=A0ABY6N506_9ALTE|nr:bacterioferritin [Alkalimarinus alittae]UZE97054.1 bacterioferritin [Alkalimarinus alittae]
MKGDKKVIELLNKCLGNELIAINQYFLHARMFKHWGLGELDKREYKKSIKDMKQADKLIERVLFLEGIPNLQKLGKLLIGENTQEILECDLKLQVVTLQDIREAMAHCETLSDYVSRDLLGEILEAEEEHLDWIEAQLGLIENISIENYLQSMIGD